MRRIGRATIASAVVFGASLTTWILQRPSDSPAPASIPWPDVSWVIVTTTSTLPQDKPNTPESTTTEEKRVSTTVETTTTLDGSVTVPETQTTAVAEISPETSTTAAAAN
jgi:hypothetical protein